MRTPVMAREALAHLAHELERVGSGDQRQQLRAHVLVVQHLQSRMRCWNPDQAGKCARRGRICIAALKCNIIIYTQTSAILVAQLQTDSPHLRLLHARPWRRLPPHCRVPRLQQPKKKPDFTGLPEFKCCADDAASIRPERVQAVSENAFC